MSELVRDEKEGSDKTAPSEGDRVKDDEDREVGEIGGGEKTHAVMLRSSGPSEGSSSIYIRVCILVSAVYAIYRL